MRLLVVKATYIPKVPFIETKTGNETASNVPQIDDAIMTHSKGEVIE